MTEHDESLPTERSDGGRSDCVAGPRDPGGGTKNELFLFIYFFFQKPAY